MDFWYETHMHTSEGSGCGRSSAVAQVKAYKQRGYTGIIITDHFINGYSTCPKYSKMTWPDKMEYVVAGYESAKKEGDRTGLDVFLGWEFTVRGSDFLTYGLGWDFLIDHPDLHRLDVPEYSKLIRDAGGFLAQAHPYRERPYIQHRLPVMPEYVDAIEVYNASDDNKENGKAMAFAKKHNLPMLAGTDSHSTGVYFTSGIAMKRKAKDIYDIIGAIKDKKVGLILP